MDLRNAEDIKLAGICEEVKVRRLEDSFKEISCKEGESGKMHGRSS